MQTYYPVSTITDGQGLNVTVVSYRDQLDLGLIACRELVPDMEELRTAGTPRPSGCAVLGRA
jgi:diacylglycerol O-acyltransferase